MVFFMSMQYFSICKKRSYPGQSVRFVVEERFKFSFMNDRSNRCVELWRGEWVYVVNDAIEQIQDDDKTIFTSISKVFNSEHHTSQALFSLSVLKRMSFKLEMVIWGRSRLSLAVISKMIVLSFTNICRIHNFVEYKSFHLYNTKSLY